MNQSITLFNFKSNDVRTFTDDKGEIWFCLTDVCKVLGIANVGNVASRLDKDGIRQIDTVDSLGRKNSLNFINEPNLYLTIGRSDKPEAMEFNRWIAKDVIPSIRKTGAYIQKPELSQLEIAKIMLDKLIYQEKEIKQLKTIQDKAIEELNTLPEPTLHPEQITTRQRIKQRVGIYVKKTLVSWEDAWNTLYKEFDLRYHKNVKLRAENSGKKPLDIIEELDKIEELYAIACEIFK